MIVFNRGFDAIDYTGGEVKKIEIESSHNIKPSGASICDKKGNLLMYSDAFYVYNRYKEIMPTGQILSSDSENGGWRSSFVPWPGTAKYFFFFNNQTQTHIEQTSVMPS